LLLLVSVLNRSRQDMENNAEREVAASSQNTKDDIAWLLHLFKEPMAQIHWTDLFGILNRAQLDARKSAGHVSDAANPLSCLAKIYNDYDAFTPQNLMVQYVAGG
jgi:hypothetical protein